MLTKIETRYHISVIQIAETGVETSFITDFMTARHQLNLAFKSCHQVFSKQAELNQFLTSSTCPARMQLNMYSNRRMSSATSTSSSCRPCRTGASGSYKCHTINIRHSISNKFIQILIILIRQNLYGALYKQSSAKGASQLKNRKKVLHKNY